MSTIEKVPSVDHICLWTADRDHHDSVALLGGHFLAHR
jgi:hypothetical protein